VVISFKKEINRLEDFKWDILLKYGECEYTNLVFEEVNKKLERLYEWETNQRLKVCSAVPSPELKCGSGQTGKLYTLRNK
jgi:hypothetical protein